MHRIHFRAGTHLARTVAGAIAVVALGAVVPLSANAAESGIEPTTCTRVVTGALEGAQTVASGERLCLYGATVGGAITVEPNASLIAYGTTVDGAITLSGANDFSFCHSRTLGGAISATAGVGHVKIGDVGNCRGNRIDGAVTLEGNVGNVSIARSRLTGALTANSNAPGSGLAMMIAGNTVGGEISCSANAPAPRNTGRPNVVTGARSGQCAFNSF